MIGSLGTDTLTGGDGNDSFVFNARWDNGHDTITDFEAGKDIILIENLKRPKNPDDDPVDVFIIEGTNRVTLRLSEHGESSAFATITLLLQEDQTVEDLKAVEIFDHLYV